MTEVQVDPGACGFMALITAAARDDGTVAVVIDSECRLLDGLAGPVEPLALVRGRANGDWSRACERCHAACLVPVAVVKAVEVEAGLNLPRDAGLRFTRR